MFSFFGRKKKVGRSVTAIYQVADILEKEKPGLLSSLISQEDFVEDESPGDPPAEVKRQMNYQLLAACQLLSHSEKKGGARAFKENLDLLSDALCEIFQAKGQKEQVKNLLRTYHVQYKSYSVIKGL